MMRDAGRAGGLRRHAQPAASRRRRRRDGGAGASTSSRSPARVSAPAWTACSWKCTKIRREPGATRQNALRSTASSRCCDNWCRSMPSPEPRDRAAARVLPDLALGEARCSRPKLRPSSRSWSALDDRFVRAVELLRDCRGRVIVTGMGKSGIIARKIAATLSAPARRPSSSTRPKPSTATSASCSRKTWWSRSLTAARRRRSSGCSRRCGGSARGSSP